MSQYLDIFILLAYNFFVLLLTIYVVANIIGLPI